MKCIHCKKEIHDESNFCTYCGNPISTDAYAQINIKRILQNAKILKTDLIEASAHECTCGQCSAFQGRIYSISGKDKRFPKIPDIVLKTGSFHKGCRHTFFPFCYGTSPVYCNKKDVIAFSNRPFIDYRSKEEIENYNLMIKEQNEFKQDKINYNLLKEKFPQICPKSFGGYRKMKNTNSNNFLKLKKIAKSIGLDL